MMQTMIEQTVKKVKKTVNKRILDILRCPICNEKMNITENGASLCCGGAKRHCYDFSSSGYINLSSPTQSGGGDSKAAVRARSDFLDKQYYRPVADAIASMAKKYGDTQGILIDAGCGEGYYSDILNKNGFSVIGADLSKFATDAASKRLARGGDQNYLFAVASVFSLPVEEAAAGVVTNVFAPCAEDEYCRVLDDEGVLIVAWAGPDHLMGLKRALYDTAHINGERADMPQKMNKIDEIRVSYTIRLESNGDIKNLFAMTPYYWRTSASDVDKLTDINELDTDVDIIISVFKKQV